MWVRGQEEPPVEEWAQEQEEGVLPVGAWVEEEEELPVEEWAQEQEEGVLLVGAWVQEREWEEQRRVEA